MPMIRVTFDLPAEAKQEGSWWVASCLPLDVHSQGPSQEEAIISLRDALAFFIESCIERGSIFDILREAGFAPAPGHELKTEGETVSVPLPFMLPGIDTADPDRDTFS